MRDLLPEWVEDYENFRLMPLELSADIDRLVETKGLNTHIEEVREFLATRFNMLHDRIDSMKTAQRSGSKVWLMSEEEQAGWDARVEAEILAKLNIGDEIPCGGTCPASDPCAECKPDVGNDSIEAARSTKEHMTPTFKLGRATKNASNECCDEVEEGERKEELG